MTLRQLAKAAAIGAIVFLINPWYAIGYYGIVLVLAVVCGLARTNEGTGS